uniref:hypothetical protein n=1 Tax=Rhodococcus qingshengii TaxID=334542 RepID=UPI001C4E1805|nr:hypothetical protein [Rhodococcus qingshengii]
MLTVTVGLCHSDLRYIDAVFADGLPESLGHQVSGAAEADRAARVTPTRLVPSLTDLLIERPRKCCAQGRMSGLHPDCPCRHKNGYASQALRGISTVSWWQWQAPSIAPSIDNDGVIDFTVSHLSNIHGRANVNHH